MINNEKRLKNIVENHPRDEIFQMSEDELLEEAQGILHLYDRPRVRLFERRDPFDRVDAPSFVEIGVRGLYDREGSR